MASHAVRLPDRFSRGALFGPGFATKITETDSGAESRIQRYPAGGRRRFNLSRAIDNLDSLRELMEFYIVRDGARISFRTKDWSDYATTPTWTTHRDADDAVTENDVVIGVGDGTTQTFPMVKKYTSGDYTVIRALTKIVEDTMLVALDGVTTGFAFTVDIETGYITITPAPGSGVEITAGCEFDVPTRFEEDTDEKFQIAIQSVESGELPDINVVEDLRAIGASQSRDFGGAEDLGNISANATLSELNGVLQRFTPTTSGLKLFLPTTASTQLGGPIFAIENGSNLYTLTIRNNADSATIVTIPAAGAVEIWLGLVGSTKTWIVF